MHTAPAPNISWKKSLRDSDMGSIDNDRRRIMQHWSSCCSERVSPHLDTDLTCLFLTSAECSSGDIGGSFFELVISHVAVQFDVASNSASMSSRAGLLMVSMFHAGEMRCERTVIFAGSRKGQTRTNAE